jgi:cobalt/nickel transport system ATP-binding protein
LNPLFRLTNVRYSYLNQFPAINGIDLEIPTASRIALIGANGSGKSTLLKLMDGLYYTSSGSIEFDGTILSEENLLEESFSFAFRRRVGFLFQDPEAQLFSSTVWDEICFGPLQLQWDKQLIRQKAEENLKRFGLETLRDRPPHRLSIGEKKKVALASVLILDPEIVLLDEPSAGLDPRSQSVLLELLQDWGKRNKTIITSTHDLTILREISDHVYVMQDGKVVFEASPNEALENAQLLQESNLVHVHTHRHPEVEHAHPHTHDFHAHSHPEEESKPGLFQRREREE